MCAVWYLTAAESEVTLSFVVITDTKLRKCFSEQDSNKSTQTHKMPATPATTSKKLKHWYLYTSRQAEITQQTIRYSNTKIYHSVMFYNVILFDTTVPDI